MVVNEVYGYYYQWMKEKSQCKYCKYCKLHNTFEKLVLLQASTLLKTTLKFTWLW